MSNMSTWLKKFMCPHTTVLYLKQSVQDDSSSLLDVNAMSAVPEDPEDPNRKVSDSLSLNLYDRLQCDLSGRKTQWY